MEPVGSNATLIHREDLNEFLAVVRVQPDGGVVPMFRPGQYVTLGIPRHDVSAPPGQPAIVPGGPAGEQSRFVRRAYSIASSPDVRDYVEILVVLVQGGELTSRLWTLEPGDRLWMQAKVRGNFTLDSVQPGMTLVMVCTGTGIAPYASMLRAYRGQDRWRRFVVVNGVRFAADLAYREELEAIARDDPSVLYVPTVTREPADSAWTGHRGRVQSVLEPTAFERIVGTPLHPATCHVFLCGNPDMIRSLEGDLVVRGFDIHTPRNPGNLHFERWW